jgi:hypothetical protein
MAGTCTLTNQTHRVVKEHIWVWTGTTAGAVSGAVSTSTGLTGEVIDVVFSHAAATLPTDLYDVTLLDADGIDFLEGSGYDISVGTSDAVLAKHLSNNHEHINSIYYSSTQAGVAVKGGKGTLHAVVVGEPAGTAGDVIFYDGTSDTGDEMTRALMSSDTTYFVPASAEFRADFDNGLYMKGDTAFVGHVTVTFSGQRIRDSLSNDTLQLVVANSGVSKSGTVKLRYR